MSLRNICDLKFRKPLSILAFVALVCAYNATALAEQSAQDQANRSFLWSAQKGMNTIYLLGSIHFLKKDYGPVPVEMERAYAQCKTVVFETDIESASSPAMQAKMMALGLYPEGQTLSQNVSRQTYDLLKKKVEDMGLPMGQFERLRPWFCALTLSVIELQRLGFDNQYGIDKYFFHRSKMDRKQIVALETFEYQVEIFANMESRLQESFLVQTLEDLELIKTMAADMVDAWEHGDAEKLNSIIRMSMEDHPDIYDRLFVQRNRRWVSQIEDTMKTNSDLLIVVGAGHLVGEDSLIDIFRRKGYMVRQL